MLNENYSALSLNVAKKRNGNLSYNPPMLTNEEKEKLFLKFHPDCKPEGFSSLRVGKNKGESLPLELCELLESRSITDFDRLDKNNAEYQTDVLVVGGGGAGCAAAIEAEKSGADVIIVTKLRLGDSNTIMAQGGIQCADGKNDSPAVHFLDSFGGGHFCAKKELLKKLTLEGPGALDFLCELGAEFDKNPDGTMQKRHGGGTSRKRMHSAKDSTGAEIMRTLRDEVLNIGIRVFDNTCVTDLLLDGGNKVSGVCIFDAEKKESAIIRAKTVIIATGGIGRLHFQGFPTSNHYGATGDGLVIAYKAGARLIFPKSMQYHPTGAAYPSQIFGALITEKARALGAKLLNKDGEVFVNPLEPRDVVTSAIIRECAENRGVRTSLGTAVWLDMPMIEEISGEGTISKNLPAMLRMFSDFGIDIRKEPVLVYPTLHYQNGGLSINEDCVVDGVDGLFACGEVVGGIHGTNRLMGNALLDIIVFGRTAGRNAAKTAQSREFGEISFEHIRKYEQELKALNINTNKKSPLLFPDYVGKISEV